MKPFKVKIKTNPQKITKIQGTDGMYVKIQAVRYGSHDANVHLMVLDGEGDECMFPIPGQRTPKVIHLESPVTVEGPLHYLDESSSSNDFIIFGEAV